MSKLTQEKIEVLDKLYNIKGEKSVVKQAIEAKIEKKDHAIEIATAEKNNVTEQKDELQKELQDFIEQTDKFLASFGSYDNNSFSSFQSIGIDLLFGDMLTTLRQKAPSHEDHLEDRINELKDQLETISNKINSIEEKRNELVEKLNEAEEAKEKLNDLIDDILRNNNDAYPRKYVKDVLESLCFFKEEEIALLEFLILFKEEGLGEYDDGYELRGNKYEESMAKTQEVVMLRGEIFADDSEDEITNNVSEHKEEVKEEPVAVKPTINLAPTNGVLTPVAVKEETEDAASAFKEKKEIATNNEENADAISIEEEPVDATELNSQEPAPEVEETPVVEEPVINIEENKIEPEKEANVFGETITPTNNIFEEATEEAVSPRQQLIESENEVSKVEDGALEKLRGYGLDLTRIEKDERDSAITILSEANENTINTNLDLLKNINVSEETLYKVYEGKGDK